MKIDVTNFMNSSEKIFPLAGSLDSNESKVDISNLGIIYPVEYKGALYKLNDEILLDLTLNYKYNTYCSRCLKPIENENKSKLEIYLLNSFDDDMEDDPLVEYHLLEDNSFLLDELLFSQIITSMPSKVVCKEDCKGLCPTCGKDKNNEKCNCQDSVEVDPRFEKLKDIFNGEV